MNKTYTYIHSTVRHALKKGVLVKPDACEHCGLDKVRLQGHHEDYDKPLEVIWLCRACHTKAHGKQPKGWKFERKDR